MAPTARGRNGNAHKVSPETGGMGLGGTAKKIQTLAEKAEQTYQKITELREEVEETQDTVNGTATRVEHLENEMAEQRAVLDAVATEVGVDLDAVSTEAHINEAEAGDGNEAEAEDAVEDSNGTTVDSDEGNSGVDSA